MKKLFFVVVLSIPVILALQSYNKPHLPNKTLVDSVCFSRDVLPIFLSNCGMSGCHDATTHAEGYNLTTYSGIMRGIVAYNPSGSKCYTVANKNEMPPSPRTPLTAAQKQTILTWINQGAKNTTCTDTGCDSVNVTYDATIKPILQTNCIGCHSGSAPSGGINLTNDANNEVIKNRILCTVSGGSGCSAMPPGTKLTNCQIAQIRKWSGGGTTPTPCDSVNVTYQGTIIPILQANCYGCHSGLTISAGIDLTDTTMVRNLRNKILCTIVKGAGCKPMPPSGSLTTCQIAQVRRWINTIPQTPCDTNNFTYNGAIKPILQSQCISCHSKPTPQANIDLTDDAMNEKIKSKILCSVTKGSGCAVMPPAGMLNACQTTQIRKWAGNITSIPCDTTTVTYTGSVKPLLQYRCISCHNTTYPLGGIDLTNDTLVKLMRGKIVCSVNREAGCSAMPPVTPLTACEKTIIKKWISSVDNKPCDTTKITYNGTITAILQERCIGCHSGNTAAGGLDLTDSALVFDLQGIIVGTATRQPGYKPMPPSVSLTTCEMLQLQKWYDELNTTGVDFAERVIPELQVLPTVVQDAGTVRFKLTTDANVVISMYSTTGKEINRITTARFKAGTHDVTFTTQHLSHGVYFIRMKANNIIRTVMFVH